MKKKYSICISYQYSLLLKLYDTLCYIRGWTVVSIVLLKKFLTTWYLKNKFIFVMERCSYFSL